MFLVPHVFHVLHLFHVSLCFLYYMCLVWRMRFMYYMCFLATQTTMKLMETFSLHHEYVHLLRAHPNWSEDVHTKFYFRNKRQFSLAFQPIIQPQQEQPQNEETVPCLDVPCPSVQCTTSPADVVDLSSVKRTKTILSYEVAPVPNGFSVPDFSVQSQQSG